MTHLGRQVYNNSRETDLLEDVVLLQQSIGMLGSEVDRILGGMFELEQHRLSPTLITVKGLQTGLDRLTEQFSAEGLVPAVSNVGDLFRLETSHLFYDNDTIIIAIHIPAFAPRGLLKLRELVPFPIPVVNSDGSPAVHYVIPKLDKTLFAVSDDDSYQMTLSHRQVDTCLTLGDIHFCPELNVFDRRFKGSCLAALYARDLETIKTACVWAVNPPRDAAVQIAEHEFLLYQAEEAPVRLLCEGKRDRMQLVKGARNVMLPARCDLTSTSFRFEGRLDLSTSVPGFYTMFLNVSALLLSDGNGEVAILDHLAKLELVGTDKGMTIRHIAKDYHWSTWKHQATTIGSSLAAIVFSAFLVWVAFRIGCRRVFSCVFGQKETRRPSARPILKRTVRYTPRDHQSPEATPFRDMTSPIDFSKYDFTNIPAGICGLPAPAADNNFYRTQDDVENTFRTMLVRSGWATLVGGADLNDPADIDSKVRAQVHQSMVAFRDKLSDLRQEELEGDAGGSDDDQLEVALSRSLDK
jgi:hypothetical protein